MSAAEAVADAHLVEALRADVPVRDERVVAELTVWRDGARLDESVRNTAALPSGCSVAALAPAAESPGKAETLSGALSPETPDCSAAGPDDTDRSGGGANTDRGAVRDAAACRAAQARAAEIHRTAMREQHRLSVAACRALINALLCERCERSIVAGDCRCRARRSNRKATR